MGAGGGPPGLRGGRPRPKGADVPALEDHIVADGCGRCGNSGPLCGDRRVRSRPLAAVRIAGAALVFYITLYAAFRFRDLLRKQGGSPNWKWVVFTLAAVLLALLDVGLRDWLTDF